MAADGLLVGYALSDAISEINSLDADDRALAIHEAGHAVVARAFGANVVFVEINFKSRVVRRINRIRRRAH
jgi:hypothetical protein